MKSLLQFCDSLAIPSAFDQFYPGTIEVPVQVSGFNSEMFPTVAKSLLTFRNREVDGAICAHQVAFFCERANWQSP
jgi:hypothetical protein